MKPFPDWFTELKENPLFWDRMCLKHSGKNLNLVAQNVYDWLLAKNDNREMPEARALFDRFASNHPKDAVNVIKSPEPVVEVEVVKPLTGEARQQKINEWLNMVLNAPILKPARKLTSEQIEEEGGVRPKATPFERSELEKRIVLQEHNEKVREARTKYYLEAFPDASEEEINEYLKKFK